MMDKENKVFTLKSLLLALGIPVIIYGSLIIIAIVIGVNNVVHTAMFSYFVAFTITFLIVAFILLLKLVRKKIALIGHI